jgi:hypothetical protein
VTLYAIAFNGTATPSSPLKGGNPPCHHPSLGGPAWQPLCIAAIANLQPTGAATAMTFGLAAAGGGQPASPFTLTTPGGTPAAFTHGTPYGPKPGIGIGKFGSSPRGTVSLFIYTPDGNTGITNMASSTGFPWTTGMLTIKATKTVLGGVESWKITGKDNRNDKGVGTIKMVSGALSKRTRTGDNANRGWVKLVLNRSPEPGVPALSPASLAAMAALMLLAAGYAMRRRLFA